jgi:hypothetical protein
MNFARTTPSPSSARNSARLLRMAKRTTCSDGRTSAESCGSRSRICGPQPRHDGPKFTAELPKRGRRRRDWQGAIPQQPRSHATEGLPSSRSQNPSALRRFGHFGGNNGCSEGSTRRATTSPHRDPLRFCISCRARDRPECYR